jgi:small subunit ribosomal protein S8
MMTDPIADLLTRIRNANRARKEHVQIPWSRLKERVARVMVAEGFLGGVEVVGDDWRRQLRVELRYNPNRVPVITGLSRVSKPSLRVYVGSGEIPAVRHGLGVSILSTSKGVLGNRDARQQGVGGEVLCAIW